MNDTRRRLLADAQVHLRDALSALDEARQEEQDYFDNMPESFQSGDKGSAVEEAIDTIANAHDEIESAADSLDDIIGGVSPTPEKPDRAAGLLRTLERIAAGDPYNENFAALAIAEARDAIEAARR